MVMKYIYRSLQAEFSGMNVFGVGFRFCFLNLFFYNTSRICMIINLASQTINLLASRVYTGNDMCFCIPSKWVLGKRKYFHKRKQGVCQNQILSGDNEKNTYFFDFHSVELKFLHHYFIKYIDLITWTVGANF